MRELHSDELKLVAGGVKSSTTAKPKGRDKVAERGASNGKGLGREGGLANAYERSGNSKVGGPKGPYWNS